MQTPFPSLRMQLLHLDRWLILKLLISWLALMFLAPSLLPDEAQYWVWSKHLDIGYYSKPPGIAWLIALSTSIFGDTAWAVRLPSLLLTWLGASYLEKGLKALNFSWVVARSSARLFVFCPLMLYGSFAATTDVGLLVALCALLNYLAQPYSPSRGWKLAAAAFFGMLFKPLIILLVPCQLMRPSFGLAPEASRLRDGAWIFLGSLLALIFPLYWNSQHDWMTLRHMLAQLTGQGSGVATPLSWARPLELLGLQVLLLSPWLAFLALRGAGRGVTSFNRQPSDDLATGCHATCCQHWIFFHSRFIVVVLLFAAMSSLKVKYQANWLALIYPSAFYLVSNCIQHRSIRYVTSLTRIHCLIHSALIALVVTFSWMLDNPVAVASKWPWGLNFFRHSAGMASLQPILASLGFDSHKQFIISDKYQSVSQLSFYLPQAQVYWFNLHQSRKNQFSFYPVADYWRGQSALFVAIENESVHQMSTSMPLYLERLQPYFKAIKSQGVIPLIPGRDVRSLLWIEVEGYLGTRPEDPQRY